MVERVPGPVVTLAIFYALSFGALGVTLPFLPAYLHGLGLSVTQVGMLLALSPAASLVAPPLWGKLADRTRRGDLVLLFVSLGGAFSFAPLLWVRGFGALVAVFAGYAFFNSAVTPLADSLTLGAVRKSGADYAHVRLFGSIGFVVATTAFGTWGFAHARATVAVPLVLMVLAGSWAALAHPPVAEAPHPLPATNPLRSREGLTFLSACALHWLACAPFNGGFAIHVHALGMPGWVVGFSAGLGVLAEVGVFALYPRLARVLAPRRWVLVSLGASALRWWGMAHARRPWEVIALTVLHGLTFGAFYAAAVQYIASQVPDRMRAAGQGFFAMVTFGMGGVVGYLASGLGYDLMGGAALFQAASGVELLAMAVLLCGGV